MASQRYQKFNPKNKNYSKIKIHRDIHYTNNGALVGYKGTTHQSKLVVNRKIIIEYGENVGVIYSPYIPIMKNCIVGKKI